MTKDEILVNNEVYPKFEGMGDKNDLFEAMDEWAKIQGVAFMEFIEDEKYVKSTNGFYHNEVPVAGKQVFFDLTELYDKFLKTQQ